MGYRIDKTKGVATGNEPETIYMVTSGSHYNSGCCFGLALWPHCISFVLCVCLFDFGFLSLLFFLGLSHTCFFPFPLDYGNAETDNLDEGAGTMESVYFGNSSDWGHGAGTGPWVMADLENGLWPGNVLYNPNNTAINWDYVIAMVKGGTDGFALKAGSAAEKTGLLTLYDGPRPSAYQPMKKQGAIILGIGGDNSAASVGTFYEGVITKGYSSDSADNAVYMDILSAGYGQC